jgi:hypothetical protein
MSVKVRHKEPKSSKGAKTAPSTPTAPSTNPVETVESVEAQPNKPILDWFQGKPLHENFRTVGRALAMLVPPQSGFADQPQLDRRHGRPPRQGKGEARR